MCLFRKRIWPVSGSLSNWFRRYCSRSIIHNRNKIVNFFSQNSRDRHDCRCCPTGRRKSDNRSVWIGWSARTQQSWSGSVCLDVVGLKDRRKIISSDVGFRIGPRINAVGRMAGASAAVDLFSAANRDGGNADCRTTQFSKHRTATGRGPQ